MLQISGELIPSLPFKNLKKVADLVEFEGPILSHFTDDNNEEILFYWVDYNQDYNRWLVISVPKKSLYQYLLKEISLRTLFGNQGECYTVDIDTNIQYCNITKLDLLNLPIKYLPEETAYFFFEINDVYSESPRYIKELSLVKYS